MLLRLLRMMACEKQGNSTEKRQKAAAQAEPATDPIVSVWNYLIIGISVLHPKC